jgi:5-formyltetrahydrofolate cyclo-ligase
MNKLQLRQHFLDSRKQITKERQQQAALYLFNCLKKISYKYTHVFSFMSFKSEIDLSQLNEFLLKENKLYLPAIADHQMEFYKASSFENLERSPFGFLSPAADKASFQKPNSTTLILVPGIAFDVYGHRLGYGKGHYDEFFSKAADSKKIAVAYHEQLCFSKIPYESHDKELDGALFF